MRELRVEGIVLFAAGACTMGVPYTCVECACVCVITAAVFTLWFVCSLNTALNCKPSSVNSLSATVNGHSASHNSDTCRPAGEYRNETKTGKKKPKQTEGLQLLYDITLKIPNNDRLSLSHTHVRTLRRMQTKTVFATLQHFTRVSTCLL